MWTYRVDGTLELSQMFVKGQLLGPSILYHADGSTVVRILQFMHNLQVCVLVGAVSSCGSRTFIASLMLHILAR